MSATAAARAGLSIGEVLEQLRAEFPDVTISKIRFLESEGLVQPHRTASGYRKFDTSHVQRLRYVLAAQRDQYLPLKVIREHLEAMDRGLQPPDLPGGGPRVPVTLVHSDGLPGADSFVMDRAGLRLSRDELLEAAGVEAALLTQLESFGLVRPRPGGHYDGDALQVAKAAGELNGFGFEPRHLRAFKAAADREVGLIAQVVTPLRRQRNDDARARAEETQRELASLSVQLHAALVTSMLSDDGRR
jgi:DNA-binding transcriptional MerR regulator